MGKELLPTTWFEPIVQTKFSYHGVLRKNFLRAKASGNPNVRTQQEVTESLYHRYLEIIKELYSEMPEEVTVYERNCKGDKSCLMTIWQFSTPNFMMNHVCDIPEICMIEYCFHESCPLVEKIKDMILNQGFRIYFKEVQKKDFTSYYKFMIKECPDCVYKL